MYVQLDPRREQHPNERSLLGCENSICVLGVSFPTLDQKISKLSNLIGPRECTCPKTTRSP